MTYPLINQPLSPKTAEDIILLLFGNKFQVTISEIRSSVLHYHISNNGIDNGNLLGTVKKSLQNLKNKNLAVNEISKGYWSFPSNSESAPILPPIQEFTPPPSYNGEIYVYYFPAYKELAELKQEQFFPCKIGRTSTDYESRIKSQVGTALPEKPVVMFNIKTNNPVELETIIHRILKHKNRKHPDSVGNEWFLTNKEELTSILTILEIETTKEITT